MSGAILLTDKYVRTIRVLCSTITCRLKVRKSEDVTEYDLRKELASCILGSQVRYEMAQTAVDMLEKEGLFNDTYWLSEEYNLESLIYEVLIGKHYTCSETWSYRFPRLRARQLNETKRQLLNYRISLKSLVFKSEDEIILRRRLIAMIPGLGPKQASMFLRNVSRSYELAVLDTHVLRFMRIQQLIPKTYTTIGSISTYEKVEEVIKSYSEDLGYPVGYMDWAIWATMRAASELRL